MARRAWQAASPDAAQAGTQASRAVGAPATRAASAPHGARRGPSRAGPGEPGRREGPWPERRQHLQQRHGTAAVWPRQVWCPWLSCTVHWNILRRTHYLRVIGHFLLSGRQHDYVIDLGAH